MTFKTFKDWCNQRACDGCWGMLEAMVCIDLIETVNKQPFWKQEKFWKQEYEQRVLDEVVNPINDRIGEE